MKALKYFLFVTLCSVAFSAAQAQKYSRYFNELDSFYVDAENILGRSTSRLADSLKGEFLGLYQNQLSDEQKQKVFDISGTMLKGGYTVRPHLESFYACITYGLKSNRIDNTQLDKFLGIADTTVTQYKKEVSINFFKTVQQFMQSEYIYKSRYNSLAVVGGTFSFGHVHDTHLLGSNRYEYYDDVAPDVVVEEEEEPQEEQGEEWFDHLEGEEGGEESEKETKPKPNADGGWGDDTAAEEDPSSDDGGGWGDGWGDDSSSDDGGWGNDWGDDSSDGGGWGDDWGDDSSSDNGGGWGDDSGDEGSWSDDGWGSDDSSGWGNDDWGGEEEELGQVEEYEGNDLSFFEEEEPEMTEEERAISYMPDTEIMPEVTGPFISLENVDLKMTSPYDTMHIDGVVGSLMAKNNVFVGNGGRIFWNNVGLPEDQVYCELPHYWFNIRAPHIKADHAEMHYKTKVDSMMLGYFTYEINRNNNKPDLATYPRFKSYYSNIEVKDLAQDVEYKGGFTLIGKKIYSTSFSPAPARITVKKEGEPKFRAASNEGFMFKDSLVSSPKASVTIYQAESDSITHPAVSLRYLADSSLFMARRDKGEFRETPFNVTYHNVTVGAEYLQWDLNADSIDISILNAREKIPLDLRSTTYFNPMEYPALTGLYRFNPMQLVCSYALEKRRNTFRLAELVDDRKLKYPIVRNSMIDIDRKGLIEFKTYSDKVTITPKGWLYFRANQRINRPNANKVDFDNFRITSRIDSAQNATINLVENELTIRGVSSFVISDSMQVLVIPDNAELKIKDNRNTEFTGTMVAGDLVFRGSDFLFNYDSFKVDMAEVDSIAFLVQDTTRDINAEVPNTLSDTGGTLFISRRNNKSGLGGNRGYPRFDAEKGGIIYFNQPQILGGVYDERIYYEMPPFKMDSINETGKQRAIEFDGTFVSSGLFPDFKEKLKVQDDNFMGFTRKTPEQGYPLFEATGNYTGEISMSGKGLRGDGKIEYLSALLYSNDFVFYSDSVRTSSGTSGIISSGKYQGTSFPSVAMKAYEMRWLVNKDSMLLNTKNKEPFEMYDPKTKFKGNLVLRPSRLIGSGEFETPFSVDSSKVFSFNQTSYFSQNSTFKIKSNDPQVPAMLARGVMVNYDLAERVAVIQAEEGLAQDSTQQQQAKEFSFPYTNYVTDINTMIWNLDQGKLVMSASGKKLGKFISKKKVQYGLEYYASSAIYNLKDYTLNLEGVPRIQVANAHILPDSGQVVVRAGAEIDSLINAKIELNGFDKYHVFRHANVKIISRYDFIGSAQYAYFNDIGQDFLIDINRFKIEYPKGLKKEEATIEEITMTAYGGVSEEEPIRLIGGVDYAGDVKMVDKDNFIHFRGKARLALERENNLWFTYESRDSTTQGMIFIDKSITEAGFRNRLKTGLYLGRTLRQMYPSFVEFAAGGENDPEFFTAEGLLKFNDSTNTYRVISQERLENNSLYGNIMTYNYEQNRATFDGTFDLIPYEEKSTMNILTAGTATAPLDLPAIDMDLLMLLDFEVDNSISNHLVEAFEEGKLTAETAIEDTAKIRRKLAHVLTDNNLERYAEGEEIGRLLKTGIVISSANLKWSDEFQAFYSTGKIGIASALGEEIDAKVEGYIEFPKASDNNTARIFLNTPAGDRWYYFQYDKNNVFTYSNSSEYNDLLSKAKGDLKRSSNVDDINNFVNSFRMNYLGEEPAMLNLPVDDFGEDGDGLTDELLEDAGGMDDIGDPVEEELAEEEEDDDGF